MYDFFYHKTGSTLFSSRLKDVFFKRIFYVVSFDKERKVVGNFGTYLMSKPSSFFFGLASFLFVKTVSQCVLCLFVVY